MLTELEVTSAGVAHCSFLGVQLNLDLRKRFQLVHFTESSSCSRSSSPCFMNSAGMPSRRGALPMLISFVPVKASMNEMNLSLKCETIERSDQVKHVIYQPAKRPVISAPLYTWNPGSAAVFKSKIKNNRVEMYLFIMLRLPSHN